MNLSPSDDGGSVSSGSVYHVLSSMGDENAHSLLTRIFSLTESVLSSSSNCPNPSECLNAYSLSKMSLSFQSNRNGGGEGDGERPI